MKAIKKNLTDEITARERIMYCRKCGERYSAHAGDYFFIDDPEYVFKHCGEPMVIGYFTEPKFREIPGPHKDAS